MPIRVKSEDVEAFSNLQTHMPNYHLKLLYAVNGSDKMLILNFFAFTGLIYIEVLQIDFMGILYFEACFILKVSSISYILQLYYIILSLPCTGCNSLR